MSSKRTIVLLGIALLAALALAAQLCSSRLAARRSSNDGSTKQASSGETSRASLKHPRAAEPPSKNEKDPSARHGDTGNARHVALPAVSFESQSRYGALVGRVVNWSSRRGVAGAELSFMHEGVSHTLTTAPDGSYRFEAPSPGTWVLAAVTADGFLPYAPDFGRDSVVFVPRPRREIQHADLLLFPAVDYVGLVVDPSGKPVAGAEVELFGADSGERAMVGIPSSFRSDGEGRFEFHAPDNALLEARHPDHAPGRARLDGAAAISHTLTITLGSAPSSSTASITGVVVDASGVGIAGVELTAEADKPGPFTREATGTTDDDGSFRLGPLDEHSYVVVARLRGRPSLRSGVVQPGAHVELRMASGNVLRGQLVDDAGQPVPMGTVMLREVAGPLARTHVSGLSVFDPQGEFEFREVPPGNYELLAIAQGRPRSEPTPVTIPTEDLVRVVLEEGARLSGEVVEQGTDEPIEMALITVDGIDADDSILSALSSTVTDAEGRFELVGVTPGRVSVNVAAFAHDARIISGIELESGQAHGPLRIELASVAADARPKTEITGIGVAIGGSTDVLSINEVFPGGGAEAAGIVAGESILAVDGTPVAELGFEDAIQNIRGQVGTTVEIELLRLDGSRATLEVERRVVQTH